MSDSYDVDVVIVGAGASGSIIAKELIQKTSNLRVMILEAGGNRASTFEGHQEYLQNFYEALIKIPNSPFPSEFYAPHPTELDVHMLSEKEGQRQYVLQNGQMPFRTAYIRAMGGTMLHWLGSTLRLRPNDLKMKSTFGKGLDWPISYKTLMPFYRMAEFEIGVAGDAAEQSEDGFEFEKDYCYPMEAIPKSHLDMKIAALLKDRPVNHNGKELLLRVVGSPQGRNSIPNPNYRDADGKPYKPIGAVGNIDAGLRCEGNSSCVPICPVQAKYNPLKTLSKVTTPEYSDRLQIHHNAVATQINWNRHNGMVESIKYVRYHGDSLSPKEVKARIYVIAAHAVETAKLLKISNCPNKLIGKNLMDHPFILAWGLADWPTGAYRGPGVTSTITNFCDTPDRKDYAAFRIEIGNWGWNWAEIAPYTTVETLLNKGLYGKQLRNELAAQTSRQMQFNFLTEQLPDESNYVTIDHKNKDRLGLPKPVLHYNIGDYERAGLLKAKHLAKEIFSKIEITEHTKYDTTDPGYFLYDGDPGVFYGAGHIGGTHIMGTSKENSVVDSHQRSHDHKNLFLAGPGSFPTMGTSNPTLTVAALAFRTAAQIEKELNNN